MNLNFTIRAISATVIAIFGFAMSYGISRFIVSAVGSYGIYSGLLALTGGILILLSIGLFIGKLLNDKYISKIALTIYLFINFITVSILLFFIYGVVQDISGVHCAGFFGVSTSCTFSSNLIAHLLVLNPYGLVFFGLLSIFGLYFQHRYNKKVS